MGNKMWSVRAVKILITCSAMLVFAACGRSFTAQRPDKSFQTLQAPDTTNSGATTTTDSSPKPALPSDEELEKIVDIVPNKVAPTYQQKFANEEDAAYVPPEVFVPNAATPAVVAQPAKTEKRPPQEPTPGGPSTKKNDSAPAAPQPAAPQPVAPAPAPSKPVAALPPAAAAGAPSNGMSRPSTPTPEPKKTEPAPVISPADVASAPALRNDEVEAEPVAVAPAPVAPQPAAPAPVKDPSPAPKPAAPAPAPKEKKETPPSATTSGDSRDQVNSKAPKGQAIRFPDRGSLKAGASLLERRKKYGDSSPFEMSKRTVDEGRYYGTDDLLDFVDFLAQYLKSLVPDRKLLVADLANKNGGPVCCAKDRSGKILYSDEGKPVLSHSSHQNGLDVDIGYIPNDGIDRFFSLADKKVSVRNAVNIKAQLDLFQQAVKSQMIDVILIYPSLKKELCIEAYKQGAFEKGKESSPVIETLKKLVDDSTHDDHFHVRLKCDPKTHPSCENKKSLERGHGCVIKA